MYLLSWVGPILSAALIGGLAASWFRSARRLRQSAVAAPPAAPESQPELPWWRSA